MARSKQNARKAKNTGQPTPPKKKGTSRQPRGVLSEIPVGRSENATTQETTSNVKNLDSNNPPEIECTLPAPDPIINKFALRLIGQRLEDLIASSSTLSLGGGNDFVELDQVPALYETRYGVSLEHRQLGYKSLASLVEDLPGVDIYRPLSSPSSSEVCEYIGRHVSLITMDNSDGSNNTPTSTADNVNNTSVVVTETTQSVASNDDTLDMAENLNDNVGLLEKSDDDDTVLMDHDSDSSMNLLESSVVHHRLIGVYFPMAFIDRVGMVTTNDTTTHNDDAVIQETIQDSPVPVPFSDSMQPTSTFTHTTKLSCLQQDAMTHQKARPTETFTNEAEHLPAQQDDMETEEVDKNHVFEFSHLADAFSFPLETITEEDDINYVFDFSHPADAFTSTVGSPLEQQDKMAEKESSPTCKSKYSHLVEIRRAEDTKGEEPAFREAGEKKNRWGERKGGHESDRTKRRTAGMQLAKTVALDIFPKTSYYNTLLFILSSSPTGLRKREINRLIPELDAYLQTLARAHYEPVDYLSLGDLLRECPAIQKKNRRSDGKNTYHLADTSSY